MARIAAITNLDGRSILVSLREELLKDHNTVHIYIPSAVEEKLYSSESLFRELKNTDILSVLIKGDTTKSSSELNILSSVLAFADQLGDEILFIPIVYKNAKLPDFLNQRFYIDFDGQNYSEVANQINRTYASFLGRKEALEQREEVKREIIEKRAADFIDPALSMLQKRTDQTNIIAIVCYIVGFLSLVCGICVAVIGLKNLKEISDPSDKVFVLIILKSIIIVGLLITCSKYAFNLGKNYMLESLRNANRRHAISFGRFYLQAFPDRANTFEEIKTMFQNWNIDKESAFEKLDSDSFDPKVLNKVLEITKSITDKIPLPKKVNE